MRTKSSWKRTTLECTHQGTEGLFAQPKRAKSMNTRWTQGELFPGEDYCGIERVLAGCDSEMGGLPSGHSTFPWRRDGSPSNRSIGTRRCGQRRGAWQKLSSERWCNAAFGVMVLPSPSSGLEGSFNMHLYAERSGELGCGWEVRARQGWSPCCAPRRLSTKRSAFPMGTPCRYSIAFTNRFAYVMKVMKLNC